MYFITRIPFQLLLKYNHNWNYSIVVVVGVFCYTKYFTTTIKIQQPLKLFCSLVVENEFHYKYYFVINIETHVEEIKLYIIFVNYF